MIQFLLFVFSIVSPLPPTNPTVHIYGALYNIMHHNNMIREVELPHLDPNNLYALGALENLKGEILILDGKTYISSELNGKLVIDNTYDHAATLLVASYVERWDSVLIAENLENKEALQVYVEKVAAEKGLDTEKPFPFLLKGKFAQVDWHVINWPEGDTEHTHEKHQTSGAQGCFKKEAATVLGFFSKHHAGVFTHHSTFLHMHVKAKGVVGHVDKINLGKKLWLYLPVTGI